MKKTNSKTAQFKMLLAAAIATAGVSVAHAETVEIEAARHFKIECNTFKKIFGACRKEIKLPNKMYVSGIEIRAKGLDKNSSVEIHVNGDYKGEVNAPIYGAQSYLPIQAWTDEISVNVEKGEDVVIAGLEVETNNEVRQGHELEVGERHEGRGHERREHFEGRHLRNPHFELNGGEYPLFDQDSMMGDDGGVAGMAYQTQEVVLQFKQLANFGELQTYLGPIQVAAAKLVAVSQTHFASEEVTRQSIQSLSAAITAAGPFLSQQLETDFGQGLASELMTIKAQLDNLTR